MDIKCRTNPYYFGNSSQREAISFQGAPRVTRMYERMSARMNAGLCEDILVRRPVAKKSATGLLGLFAKAKNAVTNYFKSYKENISHTFDHKLVFAVVEKELFGKNSIDSITHDLDKLVLYALGFPKSIVTNLHRRISEHHVESRRAKNLRSMLCDNIASSPEFKPEKTKSLRQHYEGSADLQAVKGLKEILERYNFGENVDFESIKSKKDLKKNYLPNKVYSLAATFTSYII